MLNVYSLELVRSSSQNGATSATTLLGTLQHATFEVWFKLASKVNTERHTILSKNGYTDYNLDMYINSSTSVDFMCVIGGKYASFNFNPTVGTWYHVAAVYDGTLTNANRVKFWLDGVSQAVTIDDAYSTSIANNSQVIKVGSVSDDTSYFDGLIDEFRIWNTSRSEAEIQANYNKMIAGSTSGLVLYYQFEEGTGTDVDDKTSSGLDLSLANTPAWETDVPFAGTPEPSSSKKSLTLMGVG